jgi:cytochrome c oxidase subunit 3
MLLFIISEVMVFGAFFTAYFFIRVVAGDEWFPFDEFHLPRGVAGINTAILLSSSVTIHMALVAVRRGNRSALKFWMVLTTLLGATFLGIQINEYRVLTHEGITPQAFAQGSVFYGLTGLHGAHVFIGLVLLTIVTVRAFRGHFTPAEHRGLEVPSIYWHFVDIMWVVVYSSVYWL